jgi:mannose-1-phosphate guanylyltransferase
LFVAAPNVSIDDAVFERTALGAVVQTPLRWSDVGTWDAVWRDAPKDENGIASFGDTVVDGCKDSLIYATSRLVSVSGLTDVAVVETSDAIFVAPRQAAHEAAKGVVEHLKKNGREEGDLHTTVYRPWGHYETLSTGNGYKVKRLFVKPGGKLSLQRHLHRAEHWVVTRGSIVVTLSGQTHALSANKSFFVDRGAVHRIENKTQEDAELIEVQTGDLLEENDIERLDDVYGR